MMFNSFFNFFQNKTGYLYENSLFLQNIDKFILPFILLTFVSSTFMNSDYIGFFALIVIFLSFVKLFTVKGQRFILKSFEILLVIYFMFVVVSLFGSTLFVLSLKGFFKTFVYIAYYFSLILYLKDNSGKIPFILGTIGLCILGESLIGVFQSTLHLEQIATWQDVSQLKPFNPNLYGGYLVSGLPVVLGSVFYFWYKNKIKLALLSVISSFVVVYTIFQTGCRGAYLSMMLVFFSVFVVCAHFFWKKYKKVFLSLIASAFVFFSMVMMFASSLRHRFLSIFAMRGDSSNSFRFNVYHSSLEMFKDNWLLGIGVGNKNFREIYGLYMKTGFDALSAYNIYLEIAVESGIFALISFLVFLIMLCVDAVKYILKSCDYENIILISMCMIAIWSMLFHGIVDTVFFRPQLQFLFWTFVAVISSLLPNNITKNSTLVNDNQ